jgi:PAS domain S-box-containing protein
MQAKKRSNTAVTDVTISDQLLKENIQFPQLPDAFPDPILITNTKGIIFYVNPAWQKLTGYRSDEVVGKNPKFLSSGKTPKEIYVKLWKNLSHGKKYITEDVIDIKKNGTEYQVRSVFFPIRKREENLFYVQVITDITDRKLLEKELQDSEHKYRDLMEKAAEGIILFSPDGKVIEVNRKICRMLGYTKKELSRMHQYDLTDPEDLAKHPPHNQEILAGKTIRNERLLIKKGGTKLPVELTAKLLPSKVIQIMYRDISRRKELEKQKDTFIGVAAHELKTPITSIKAYAQILMRKQEIANQQDLKMLTTQINYQVIRLTELVEDLLHVNKLQSGRFEIYKKKVNLDAKLQEVVNSIQTVTKTHEITFKGKLNSEVNCDENRIGQVVINLLTNAIKYSPDAKKVIVHIKTDKKHAVIGVQDFGLGIDKNDQDKIFELFYRIHDHEVNKISGFGLGLYICSEIIKKHKGKIWVESKIGKGSTFYFSLPLATI